MALGLKINHTEVVGFNKELRCVSYVISAPFKASEVHSQKAEDFFVHESESMTKYLLKEGFVDNMNGWNVVIAGRCEEK